VRIYQVWRIRLSLDVAHACKEEEKKREERTMLCRKNGGKDGKESSDISFFVSDSQGSQNHIHPETAETDPSADTEAEHVRVVSCGQVSRIFIGYMYRKGGDLEQVK